MCTVIARWFGSLALAFTLQATLPAAADGTQPASMPEYVAIQGYDVVSLFHRRQGGRKGSSEISLPFDDLLKWQFANTSHKDMFAARPGPLPAASMAACAPAAWRCGVSVPAESPDNWVIVDGKSST